MLRTRAKLRQSLALIFGLKLSDEAPSLFKQAAQILATLPWEFLQSPQISVPQDKQDWVWVDSGCLGQFILIHV